LQKVLGGYFFDSHCIASIEAAAPRIWNSFSLLWR